MYAETASVAEFQRLARAGDRGLSPPRCRPDRGRRVRAVCPGDPRRLRVPGHRPSPARPAGAAARLAGSRDDCTERLREVDPYAAAQILPGNGRRIVRALEVVELTGRPYGPTLPAHRYGCRTCFRSGWTSTGPASMPGSLPGWTRCGRPGWSPRWRRSPRTGCAKDVRLPALSATDRCWSSSTATSPRQDAKTATVAGDAQVRPAAGLVVPEGSTDHLVAVGSPDLRRSRVHARRESVPTVADARLSACAGGPSPRGTAPRTTSCCCSTGRPCSISVRAEVRVPLRSARRNRRRRLAPGRARQTHRRVDGRRLALVHGLPQRGWFGGRDVRKRHPGVRPVPARPGPRVRARRPVATRAGLREATVLPDGRYRVAMGRCRSAARSPTGDDADGRCYSATSR